MVRIIVGRRLACRLAVARVVLQPPDPGHTKLHGSDSGCDRLANGPTPRTLGNLSVTTASDNRLALAKDEVCSMNLFRCCPAWVVSFVCTAAIYLALVHRMHAEDEKRRSDVPYPAAPRSDVEDDYHGTRVADPFRPLEDPDSPETRAWVTAENELTFGFLAQIPAREPLKRRLTALWNYEKFSVPFQEGDRYFYSHNSGLQNQNVLFTTDSLDAEPRVLLDPNLLSKDGTVALAGLSVSHDGKLLAYALADAGSDWTTWHVRDVDTGKDLDDLVRWSKFSGAAWTHDGRGFYYGRYPEPAPGQDLQASNYFQKLYFHKLGTPQGEDRLIYERPDQKKWKFSATVTDDGHYLVIGVSESTDDRNRLLVQDLTQAGTRLWS